jgi:hypothetical protein
MEDAPMKLHAWWSAVVLVASPGLLFGQSPPYQSDFPPEVFRARWAGIFDRMGERSLAIIQGMPKPSGFVFASPTSFITCAASRHPMRTWSWTAGIGR